MMRFKHLFSTVIVVLFAVVLAACSHHTLGGIQKRFHRLHPRSRHGISGDAIRGRNRRAGNFLHHHERYHPHHHRRGLGRQRLRRTRGHRRPREPCQRLDSLTSTSGSRRSIQSHLRRTGRHHERRRLRQHGSSMTFTSRPESRTMTLQ